MPKHTSALFNGATRDWWVYTPAGLAPSTIPHAIQEFEGDEPGTPAEFSCPMCRGTLTEARSGEFHQFRCHVGHTFSIESVLAEQTEETERALWAAVRALDESSALALRMMERSTGDLRERFSEKHETLHRQAQIIRAVLLGKDHGPPALLPTSESAGIEED